MQNSTRIFHGVVFLTIFGILVFLSLQRFDIGLTLKDIRLKTTSRLWPPHHQLAHSLSQQDVQTSRLQVFHRVCKDISKFEARRNLRPSKKRFYFAWRYNFSLCKVPKSASTFVTQSLSILNNASISVDELFNKMRKKVHNDLAKHLLIYTNRTEFQQAPAVIVSRDPYTRLYSAFIDKVFLFDAVPDIRNVSNVKRKQKCLCKNNTDISFQKFLNYIVRNAADGKTLDIHWQPIYSLCHPCDVNTHVIVKLETFPLDIEYVLDKFNVDETDKKPIIEALHENRLRSTIKGIVKTVYGLAKKREHCMCLKAAAERLWVSFQIQGYIRKNMTFPHSIVQNEHMNYKDEYVFSEFILKVIQQNPLLKHESRQQRRQYLVDAYQSVTLKTITALQQLYRMDFQLFDYDKNPPVNL